MKREIFSLGIAALVLVWLSSPAKAQVSDFDGQRQGVVLTAGVTGSGILFARREADFIQRTGVPMGSEKALAPGWRLGMGLSTNNHLLLNLEYRTFRYISTRDITEKSVKAMASLYTAGATYFLKSSSPSPFISAGLGISRWENPHFENYRIPPTRESYPWMGFGGVLGIGYEIRKHLIVEMDAIVAETGETLEWSSGEVVKTHSRFVGLAASLSFLAY